MVNIAGTEIPVSINISGFLSSSWIYVFFIAVIGFIIIAVIGTMLFMRTYNRKIVVFDNISGQGYQVAFRSRARIIKLGPGGTEIMKTLFGGNYVSAYGRKMAKNQYWFAKGSDGYWYNVLLGDLDTKLGILDIVPVDRDVRMQHVAIGNMARTQYEKKNNMEKWVFAGAMILVVLILVVGAYFIYGKIAGFAVDPKVQQQIADVNLQTVKYMDSIANKLGLAPSNTSQTGIGGSGLISAG